MREVFENIIEMLEEELKLANKDKERCAKENHLQFYSAKCYANGIANAIEIVKKAAEECKHGHFGCNTNGQHEKCSTCCDYDCKNRNREWFGLKDDNNGWIPCSVERPKVENLHEISIDDCTGYLVQRRCGLMDVAHYISVYGVPYFEANALELSDVIAWQTLPAPYQPHICTNNDCALNEGKDCPAAEGCAGYERKRTNFDACCESIEAMAQIIEIAKIGWTKEQIMEWLQKEECEVSE